MDKLTMAHEYAMAFIREAFKDDLDCELTHNLISREAWKYADAMQAEADSRVNKDRPDVLKEWQPDWSQAPVKTVAWRKTESNECEWLLELRGEFYYNGKAPDFGYDGNWQDSLRERP